MLCFRKFPMTKKIMDKRGGLWGYQDFPSKAFLSQSAGMVRRGKLLCCVSESFR